VEHAHISHIAKFMICFVAIMPLSKILDYGGEQLALYCGKVLGDLIIITLNNVVGTALAIVLLTKCDLKLLQSTVIGVVLLRLLLVPGFAFLTGGARVLAQDLHPHVVQMNSTLLTIGALTLLLPAAFFSALDRTVPAENMSVPAAVSDATRGDFLKLSRALSVFLLIVYVGSRFYLHNPPGDNDSLHELSDAPASFKADIAKFEEEEPELNPWFCIIILVVTVALTGVTAEFLVGSVKPLRSKSGIQEEWFGIVLLPLVSFSADGILSVVYFVRRQINHLRGDKTPLETQLAQGRSIDIGIQFMLFWMPFLMLIAWFSHKPLSLLFDVFEVAVLLGACFLVNHVTADSKTNWVEGLMMVTFYLMIAITVWFYPGQTDVQHMLACKTVSASLAAGPKHHGVPGVHGHNGTHVTLHPKNQTAVHVALDALNTSSIAVLNERLQKLIELHGVN